MQPSSNNCTKTTATSKKREQQQTKKPQEKDHATKTSIAKPLLERHRVHRVDRGFVLFSSHTRYVFVPKTEKNPSSACHLYASSLDDAWFSHLHLLRGTLLCFMPSSACVSPVWVLFCFYAGCVSNCPKIRNESSSGCLQFAGDILMTCDTKISHHLLSYSWVAFFCRNSKKAIRFIWGWNQDSKSESDRQTGGEKRRWLAHTELEVGIVSKRRRKNTPSNAAGIRARWLCWWVLLPLPVLLNILVRECVCGL